MPTLKAGAWLLDLATGDFTFGPGMYDLFGLDEASPVDFSLAKSLIHPADMATAWPRFERFLGGGEPFHDHYRLLLPDGTIRFVEGSATALKTKDGRPILVAGQLRDVGKDMDAQAESKQRGAELAERLRELAASDILFKTAIEDERITVYLQDASLRYLWRRNAPDSYYQGSATAGNLRPAVRPEDVERVEEAKREVIATGERREASGWYTFLAGEKVYF